MEGRRETAKKWIRFLYWSSNNWWSLRFNCHKLFWFVIVIYRRDFHYAAIFTAFAPSWFGWFVAIALSFLFDLHSFSSTNLCKHLDTFSHSHAESTKLYWFLSPSFASTRCLTSSIYSPIFALTLPLSRLLFLRIT